MGGPPGIRYERGCPSLPGFGKLGRRRELGFGIWNLGFGRLATMRSKVERHGDGCFWEMLVWFPL